MKAEHRKELATNTLADKLGQFIQSFKEGPSRNATIWGTVVVVVLALVVIYRLVSINATANDSARWFKWDQLNSKEEVQTFANENVDTQQGRLARFELARLNLENGLRDLGSTAPGDAIKQVRQAAETYETLSNESGTAPLLTQEALLNAAKARESLGEYDRAKEHYARLARDFPQSIKGKNAAEMVKLLEQPSTELQDLKQLAKEQAPPSTPTLPQTP